MRCILLILTFVCSCSASADDQYADGDQYPTAKISVMDSGPAESPSSRYALQVSGDQLQDYLKALKQVPESIYSNGAHIIADMEESSLPEALSASRYDSDQEGESREHVDLRSLIPAVRLDHRQHQNPEQDRIHDSEERPETESRRRSLVYEPEEERYEKPMFKRPSTRELLRDLLMRREDIVRSDSPLSPVAAAAAQVMDDQISHVKEAINEAKALQAAEATESLKGKVVEALKQKEADINERKAAEAQKEFATSTTARVPEIDNLKFKQEEERGDKYRAQESENKFKTQEHYKPQEVVIKQANLHAVEIGPSKEIGSPELFMSRVQDELSKSLHFSEPMTYDRENRSDTIDMKTVRELLSTLIKQIENIQSAARTLTAAKLTPDYSYESKKSMKQYNEYEKDYNKQQHRERTERPKKRKPMPYEILAPYPSEAASQVTKKPKRLPKAERTVYLKPHEVMKLLEPDTYEPVEMPIRRNRPYSMGTSAATLRRIHAPFPMRRTMYPNFYPGIAARITCCDDKCATNFGFSPPAGYKK